MSLMYKEIRAAAEVVAQQEDGAIAEVAKEIRCYAPKVLVSTGRGSSDHALNYLNYMIMKRFGLPVLSLPPSLSTTYHTHWQLNDALAIAVSQSGKSPDLVQAQTQLGEHGAFTLALVNTLPSPLAQCSDAVIDLQAGVEKSVAATKSYLATLSAGMRLIAHWAEDKALLSALDALPEKMMRAATMDWSPMIDALVDKTQCFVIGRGMGLAIAQEAALKMKETCLLQGEAFSTAEVQHGPMALIKNGFVSVIFALPDAFCEEAIALAGRFREMGGRVVLVGDYRVEAREVEMVNAEHEDLQGITAMVSYYAAIEQLAKARNLNPDAPPNLQKVTETL